MTKLLADLGTGIPRPLVELTALGRTLKKRATDVLAYFERPGHVQRTDQGAQRQVRTPPRPRAASGT